MTITAAFVYPIPGSSLHRGQNDPAIWQISLLALSPSSVQKMFAVQKIQKIFTCSKNIYWVTIRDQPQSRKWDATTKRQVWSLQWCSLCPLPLPYLPSSDYLRLQNKDPSIYIIFVFQGPNMVAHFIGFSLINEWILLCWNYLMRAWMLELL